MSRFANMMDTLQNLITGLGLAGVDSSTAAQYILELLDRATLENMYRGDWLSRKIIDQPADDMTREWRKWQASQQQIEAIETVEKTLDVQRKVKQWIIKARLYGGSAIILGVDDGNDASQPLDFEKCGKNSLKYVVVLHRWELNAGPRIYNVNDPYYTRPAYYTVATPMFGFMGERGVTSPQLGVMPEQVPGAVKKPGFLGNIVPFKNKSAAEVRNYSTIPTNIGMTQIHPSRVLELPGNELPDWRLAPMGGGWGDSVLQTVVDAMKSYTSTYQSIAAMVSDGKMDVVKIPEMSLKIKNQDYKNKLIERFALSTQTKSVISALLLDKEEEWDRVSTQYGGLPMIMHEFTTVISGAAEIPVSILFGQAYGRGMQGGSTGGGIGDQRTYYDQCRTKQKNDIAPRLGMLDQMLMRSALGKADPNIHYEWEPLWQMDDDEKAKIALAKAQATQIYATIGVINEDAFREGVVNQLIEDGTYPGLDDAIEEYGSEPEEPEDTGGYVPPGQQKQIEGQPNPKQIGHTGGMDTLDYDPDEPRDPHGKWTAEGGGGGAEGAHPGKGYSKQAKVVNGVIQTKNVNDAVRALYEGRKVKLSQPYQVATLLGKLASVSKEMEKLGAKAHNFNLCDVSVANTNLFCAESKGIPRVKMPQLPDAKAFQDYLEKTGTKVTSTDELASHLRATQDELNGAKVGGMMKAMRAGKVKDERLIVSRDNYVVDGHHRWASKVGIDSENNRLGDIKMPVARVDMDIIPLLEAADKFTGGAGHKGVGDRRFFWPCFDYSPDQPRGVSVPGTTPGSFAPSSGGTGAGTSEGTTEEGYKTGISKLRKRWAYIDKQLFQYSDLDPKDSLVKKLITEQVSLTDQIHSLQFGQSSAERRGDPVRDVVVVGAGPAGIQAGIYGGSEGLNTLVVDAASIAGGQAGSSSRIENLMGFPTGVSGAKLAEDGVLQAQRLGAEIRLNRQVTGLSYDPNTGLKTLKFTDGSTLQSKAVIIAGGVQFNHVKIPGSDSPDVVYGSSGKLKKRVGDGDAIIVGGANSAGQAAMDTAITSRHVTLLARSGLAPMSGYLREQIEAHPRITVKRDEIIEIRKDNDGRMTGAVLKDGTVLPAKGVLYAIGSMPFTNWVSNSAIERDEKGFIKTGGVGREHLETNIPGVFAAGDVRTGSVKRVVTASADGATAIAMTHAYLEKAKGKGATDAESKRPRTKKRTDPATEYFHRLVRYDSEEQTYTGAPEEADDNPTGKPTTKHP